MNKRRKLYIGIIGIILCVVTLVGIIVTHTGNEKAEAIKEVMKDAVLHEENQINLFGIRQVNPAFLSAIIITVTLLCIALVIRIFIIPKFKIIPGKFQMVLEEAVGFFDKLAKDNSPLRNGFLGAYLFAAGCYIFLSTLFELFGIQGITTRGLSISLPVPLSDINGAIAMGCLSYLVILSGGIAGNGIRGVGNTLKEFSLPVSMSFRLFGALLSGLLVTELVYYYIGLSFVLPVIVNILFTLLHAVIQTYVLIMLTALFYGEVSEPHKKKEKNKKTKKITQTAV